MKDLSSLLTWATGLNAGESQSAGNTVCYDSKNVAMGAPGSQPVNKIPQMTDIPDLEVPAMKPKASHLVDGGGNGGAGTWETLEMTTGFKKVGE